SSAVIVSEPIVAPSLTLASTSGDGSYHISWNSVGNTSSYVLEENGQALSSISSTSKSFSGGSAKGNGTYSYRIKACNPVGCSAFSSTKTVDVALAPGVPSSITVPEAAV